MLIILPPSEGKTAPRRGRPLDLGTLSFSALHEPRERVLDALVALCVDSTPEHARVVLGLGPAQEGEVARNAALRLAPTARADRVYTGVLYQALGLAGLDAGGKRRAASRLVVVSGLFGLLRTSDRIPAYRLAGGASLPGVGAVAQHWRRHLGPVVESAAGGGLVADLRSSAYTSFWRPQRSQAERVATLRVLQDVGGRHTVVSHFNKATKGRLVRDLLTDGSDPRTPAQLAELLGDLGWRVHADGTRLDVVVEST